MLCEYGCGQEAKIRFKNGKYCCSNNIASCPGLIPIYKNSQKKRFENKPKPPIVMRPCEKCGKEHDGSFGSGRFCSHSCSSTRNHTEETKRKIRNIVVNYVLNNPDKKPISEEKKEAIIKRKDLINNNQYNYCPVCNVVIGYGAKHCPKHHIQEHKGGLNYVQYEKELKVILEQEYGKLDRVLINNHAFDFSNDQYIIEFTFDFGRGSTEAIHSFENLHEIDPYDKRTKIVYIPIKKVGNKRKSRALCIGVKVKDSEPYRYLLDNYNKSKIQGNGVFGNTSDLDSED